MAPPFIFSQNLQALKEEYDDGRLSIQNPTAISSFRPSSLEEFVKGASFDLSDKELFCVEDQDLFDRVYSLVKDFSNVTPACKFNLVESRFSLGFSLYIDMGKWVHTVYFVLYPVCNTVSFCLKKHTRSPLPNQIRNRFLPYQIKSEIESLSLSL